MIKNIDASLRAKLLKIAKENNMTLDYLVLRYMQEKIIMRLSMSKYKDNFVLKGGLIFLLFNNLNPRVTKDIDFLCNSIPNSIESINTIFTEITSILHEDGISFESNKIKCERIKENADYEGIRVNIPCNLGKIKKIIQIDIGYGDKVYPEIKYVSYPSLLNENLKDIPAYSLEAVIAEKFEAMIKLSYINSRMKDFYDIYHIITNYNIQEVDIMKAVTETLKNRKTKLDINPVIFKSDFIDDLDRNKMWNNYVTKLKVKEIQFRDVMNVLEKFFDYLIKRISNNEIKNMKWDCFFTTWK